jgi:glutaminyl-tRNA synthetase
VKGTIHWVSAAHALPCEVRLYDRLFTQPDPDDVAEDEDFTASLNPESLVVLSDSRVEPSVGSDPVETRYQFERQGYFVRDPDSTSAHLVFNRTVTLRDTWAKVRQKG